MADIDLYDVYSASEQKFQAACVQLKLLNAKIAATQRRYDRAVAANRRCFRYSLRIELVNLEGVRNMFYQYAMAKMEELKRIKLEIVETAYDASLSSSEDDMDTD